MRPSIRKGCKFSSSINSASLHQNHTETLQMIKFLLERKKKRESTKQYIRADSGRFFFILVNKINKYSKLVTSLLTFACIVRSEFQTRVQMDHFVFAQNLSPLSPISPLPFSSVPKIRFFPQFFRSNLFLLQFINRLRETFYR
jgi:hypothetical protein